MISSTNVSTTVVGNELGVSSRSVSELCSASEINGWSKYKPVWYPGAVVNQDVAYKAAYSGYANTIPNGNHRDGDCGLAPGKMIKDTGSGAARAELIKEATRYRWHYANPLGAGYATNHGEPASAYRLGDFRRYHHNATPFLYLSKFYSEQDLNIGGSTSSITYSLDWVESGDDTGSLSIEDMAASFPFDLKRCHLYAAVYKPNGDYLMLEYNENPIVDQYNNPNGIWLSINLRGETTGRYKVYLCLRYSPEADNPVFFSIPKQDYVTASSPLYINVINDPVSGGIGIKDVDNDVSFSPWYTNGGMYESSSYWRKYLECTESNDELYYMQNEDRNMSIRVKFTNGSNKDTVIRTNSIMLDSLGKISNKRADSVYDANWNSIYSGTINVPANGTAIVYFCWQDILQASNGVYEGSEIYFKKDGNILFDCQPLYKTGTIGWYNM